MHIYVIIYSTTEQKQPNEAESSSQNYEPYTCEDQEEHQNNSQEDAYEVANTLEKGNIYVYNNYRIGVYYY